MVTTVRDGICPGRFNLAGGVAIAPVFAGDLFLGLGRVDVDGVTIRSPRRPHFVEIRNPGAVSLENFRVTGCRGSDSCIQLEFAADRREGGLMEWMVHEVRGRYSTADWSRGPEPARDTRLELELRAAKRTIGGREFSGFSYQYRYASDSLPIYKILDRGTWELGGTAAGNQFWMRNCFVPSIVAFNSPDDFFSTEWYLPSCANPNVVQFLPLQTELQGFTFTASDAGVLITWPTEVAHVRSLFEKPRDADVIVHLHEHCADLGLVFETPPVEVLFCAGGRSHTELANDYEAVREMVHEALHAQIGMRRERVTTYGLIEEWTPADIDRYRRDGLPKLLDAGVRTVYLANHFENNMNTWGVENMCCTVDYRVSEAVGAEKLRAFCREAASGGSRVHMWGNTALSTLTLMFSRRNGESDRIRFLPEEDSVRSELDLERSFVRTPSNAIEADHYTPVFAVLNLRDEAVREYWLRRWREASEEIGIGGIFLDSSFNLSSDKFHYLQNTQAERSGATADQQDLLGFYRPRREPPAAIRSQFRAHLDLMVEMQRLGYVYANEDLGVFGIHRHGPGLALRLDNLFLWSDCIAEFDAAAARSAGRDPAEVFFRGLAYRLMWALHWDPRKDELSFAYHGVRGPDDIPQPEHLELLKAYNVVEADMRERCLLPEEAGVLYRSGAREVLWSFGVVALSWSSPRCFRELRSGRHYEGQALEATPREIYVIDPPSADGEVSPAP